MQLEQAREIREKEQLDFCNLYDSEKFRSGDIVIQKSGSGFKVFEAGKKRDRYFTSESIALDYVIACARKKQHNNEFTKQLKEIPEKKSEEKSKWKGVLQRIKDWISLRKTN